MSWTGGDARARGAADDEAPGGEAGRAVGCSCRARARAGRQWYTQRGRERDVDVGEASTKAHREGPSGEDARMVLSVRHYLKLPGRLRETEDGCGRWMRRSQFELSSPSVRGPGAAHRRRVLPVVLGAWCLVLGACMRGGDVGSRESEVDRALSQKRLRRESGSADGGRPRVRTRKGRKTSSVGRLCALWQL